MAHNNLNEQVQSVFRAVFDHPTLELSDKMTANDIDGWDSLAHVNLIIALEKNLGVKFATAEISRLSSEGQNVGALLDLIRRKKQSHAAT